MTGLNHPIHVEAIGGVNVRFFAPPSGGREFPWVSIDDLNAAMALPRGLRRHFRAELQSSEWKRNMVTVAVDGGEITNIAQHFVAQGLIDAAQEVGHIRSGFYMDYAKGGARALSKLTDGLSSSDVFAYIGDAMKASGGTEDSP